MEASAGHGGRRHGGVEVSGAARGRGGRRGAGAWRPEGRCSVRVLCAALCGGLAALILLHVGIGGPAMTACKGKGPPSSPGVHGDLRLMHG